MFFCSIKRPCKFTIIRSFLSPHFSLSFVKEGIVLRLVALISFVVEGIVLHFVALVSFVVKEIVLHFVALVPFVVEGIVLHFVALVSFVVEGIVLHFVISILQFAPIIAQQSSIKVSQYTVKAIQFDQLYRPLHTLNFSPALFRKESPTNSYCTRYSDIR